MYFNPPQNNHNDFYHPLNQVNEEKQFKARVAFMGEPKDNARDMRAAGRMKMYDTATERDVPSKRKSTVFDITFKSERQFNQFMGAYDVEFLDRLDESRDDFDYLDAQAASEDRAIAGKKFMDALKKAGIKAEYVRSSGTMRVAKKDLGKAQSIGKKLKVDRDGVRMDVLREDVQLDEVTGETTVMAKSDRNQYERITRALTAANRTGKIKGYEGAHFNERTGVLTLIFDSKAHKPASERRKVAKMIKDFGLEFSHSVEEGFASDAQRRAAFASGYKAKGKKKKEGEEVEEGLRQAMSGRRETAAQKQKRQEKDNFDLYKKRQKRVAALRGDKSSRQLTPKQQRDYLNRVNLDQIKAMEDVEVDEADVTMPKKPKNAIKKPKVDSRQTVNEGARFTSSQLSMLKKEYGKIGRVDPSKPTYKKLTDMLDRMTDEQLKQIEDADIKFMSKLAGNRLSSRGVRESIDEEKGTYSSMSRRGIEKPLMGFIADLEDELKKVGLKYSDRKIDPDDVMKAYNANKTPKETAAMLKKKTK
jgi:hypothetical protein